MLPLSIVIPILIVVILPRELLISIIKFILFIPLIPFAIVGKLMEEE